MQSANLLKNERVQKARQFAYQSTNVGDDEQNYFRQAASDLSSFLQDASKVTACSAGSLPSGAKPKAKRLQSQTSGSTGSSTFSDYEPLLDFSQFHPPEQSIGTHSDRSGDMGIVSYSGIFEIGAGHAEQKMKLTAKKQRQKVLNKGGWIRPMRIDLKPQQLEELRDAFNELQDKAELMGVEKIQTVIRACGYEPEYEEVKDLVDAVSPETEGFISYTELVEIYKAKLKKEDKTDEMRRAFRLFDLDDSNAITLDNLKKIAAMTSEDLTDEELQEMLNAADSDNTGCVTMEKFVKFMKRTEYFDQE